MDNHIDTGVQELPTREQPPIDNLSTQETRDSEAGQRPRRVRKQRSFTLSDQVHSLLSAQAERTGVSMSAYIETLVLMAEDLSLDPQAIELLGAQATKAGFSKTQYLEMLIIRAEHVVTWDQQISDVLGVLAARAGLSRPEFLEQLVFRAETIMSWRPSQPKPKPWWRFWERSTSPDPPPPFGPITGDSRPQLPG